jgi:SAM-dependent methyltransferase
MSDFEALVSEAADAAMSGWDFSWLDGRATEERPPWGFTGLLVPRVAAAGAVLDVQTGGGEIFAEVLRRAERVPFVVAATEAWPPNLVLAHERLGRFRGSVVEVANDDALPFDAGSFDLVTARHPVVVRWDEIARVLEAGGTYFAQHVGAGTNRELTDFLMGPQPVSDARRADVAVRQARAAGLELVDVREASLRVEFFDVGAVVYFLRKVIWTVPDFTVERYGGRLRALHDEIVKHGSFVSHAQRFLIALRAPVRPDRR